MDSLNFLPIIFERLAIPLSAILDGETEYAFTVSQFEVETVLGRLEEAVEVVVHVTRMGDDFLVDLQAKGRGAFVCDRCGEDFVRSLQGRVRTLFTTDQRRRFDGADEIRFLEGSAVAIDLRADVIDALVLAIPMKRLCHESCRGLCPHCGANRNEEVCGCHEEAIDPRWEALRGIRFDP